MSDSQLDEVFKKQLPAHESPVPEDMWERIIRKKDKDRKGFFFFFTLLGLFILGFVAAGIVLFNINKKEIVRNKKSVSDSSAVSSSNTVQSMATDPEMKKDSSLNSEAAHKGGGISQKSFIRKEYGKKMISSEDRQAGIQQTQVEVKHESTGTGQKNSNTGSKNDLSGNTGSNNSSKTSADTGKLSYQKTNPAILLSTAPKSSNAYSAKHITLKKQDSTKNNVGKKWSLDLYASPDYPIDHRQEYVQGELSYTIGLRVNRSFGKRFSGKVGIQFSQINYVLPDTSGFPGAYRLMRLDLPVLAGYSWGNESFGMTVNAGAIFNLNSWLRPDSANYIKSNAGLSLYLGLNFSKHINDRMDIFSEPYYRYQLSTSTVNAFYFRKFIDVTGISFGVRYHFRK